MTAAQLSAQWQHMEAAPQNSSNRGDWLGSKLSELQANPVLVPQANIPILDGEDDPALISAKVDAIIVALVAAGVIAAPA